MLHGKHDLYHATPPKDRNTPAQTKTEHGGRGRNPTVANHKPTTEATTPTTNTNKTKTTMNRNAKVELKMIDHMGSTYQCGQ